MNICTADVLFVALFTNKQKQAYDRLLHIDRDSAIISNLFDENNEAVRIMLATLIRAAKAAGRKIGLCGQAPSDYPTFAQFLVEQSIDSISFTPDALLKGIENISIAEKRLMAAEAIA